MSAFSYLFSEMVQYCQARVQVTQDLEKRFGILRIASLSCLLLTSFSFSICFVWVCRLSDLGYGVGLRSLELLCFRDKLPRRERSLKAMLQFVRTTVWKALFGKLADRLEISRDSEDECIGVVLILVVQPTLSWLLLSLLFFADFVVIVSVSMLCGADYLYDDDVLTNKFISVPKNLGQLNCAAFIAGIIAGVFDAAEFVSGALNVNHHVCCCLLMIQR